MAEFGPMPVREGELIAGKYRIEGAIGSGGMGVVVSARHEQLDQRVAIKFVRSPALGNEEGVERFVREARAAVKLRSEHAARVLDVGTLESGVPYMVMELLEGSDLAQVLAERGPLPVELAAQWMAQICEALAEAHAAGIVHRDLKPQNLFLARTVGGAEHVKVLDFGVSKSIETMTGGPGALTRTSAMLGSPLYMAPEQMRSSRDVDARVDVWALGVVIFELLTQRWPFEAETLPDLCLKVVSEKPQSLAELRPDVPETMVRAVMRCLEKDRTNRFANAAELATALEPLVPPESRLLVERARLAMRHAPPIPIRTPAGLGRYETKPPISKLSDPPERTPAAWDSGGKGTASADKKRQRRPALWIGALVLTAMAIGAFALLPIRRPESAIGPAPPPFAHVAGAPTAAAELVVAVPPPAVVLAPSANGVPSTEAGPTADPAAGASAKNTTPALVSHAPWVASGAAALPRPTPPVKSSAASDDIPALR